MKKKLISVLLCVSVLLTSVVCAAAAEKDSSFNIAVASDLHYCLPEESIDGTADGLFGYANRRAAMENESGFIIDEFLRQCAENDYEYVLISGDMVNNGRTIPLQHSELAAKLAEFEKNTGKQVYVIDGNHDLGYDTATDIDDFKRIYASFGYDEALCADPDSCSYTVDLGESYRLIALDSCDHSVSTADGLTSARVRWLSIQAKKAEADGKHIILMMHHNLLDHMPAQRIFSKNFIVRNHLLNAEIFADMGIKTVFTGHEHCSDVSGFISSRGNEIYDFATTSLTMYPLQYRTVSFSDDKIDYSVHTVDSIDVSALSGTVGGYSDAQLSFMERDMNGYAFGFLKSGIRLRLSQSLSVEKTGISENDALYSLVNTALGGITNLLSMSLYGEGSVSSIAEKYSIAIPQSKYENGWELVTTLVGAHYAGSESYGLDSTEVTILLRLAALVLRDIPAEVSDEVFLKYANELLRDFTAQPLAAGLTMLGTRVFGAVTPGEYFILALVSPIIYEFAGDNDSVDDNNGSVAGYGAVGTENNIKNIYEKVISFLKKLISYLTLFTKYSLPVSAA